ncbi:hypothetical protein [Tautonia rosea]|uniref:hypothetical protein n=1 Tax=Tautonia rosea TaxID=2728037 RepID=UPI0014749F06|nr:hypothetical protein [Tautonia rosea]
MNPLPARPAAGPGVTDRLGSIRNPPKPPPSRRLAAIARPAASPIRPTPTATRLGGSGITPARVAALNVAICAPELIEKSPRVVPFTRPRFSPDVPETGPIADRRS